MQQLLTIVASVGVNVYNVQCHHCCVLVLYIQHNEHLLQKKEHILTKSIA